MPHPIERAIQLYVLIDGQGDCRVLERLAAELIAAGVHILQLRDKRLDDRQLVQRARLLRDMTRDTGTLLIVNDRPDIAVLADADGVHVGQEELSVDDARTIAGGRRLVGVSTHSIEQARQAVRDGADYIGCGPTFASTTKRFEQYPGLPLLRQVAVEIEVPAFAIGGIGPVNLQQVLETGFTRVAVSSAVVSSADVAASAQTLIERMQGYKKRKAGPPEGGPAVS